MNYSNHLDEKMTKAKQCIGVIRRLFNFYKFFVRPHLDYCDVIYHKPTYDDYYSSYYSVRAKTGPVNINYYFTNKIEAVQYNAVCNYWLCSWYF